MSLAGMDLETKRERAFRLLRGEDVDVVATVTEITPPVQIEEKPVEIDPKWGRECLACHEAKPWSDFHADASRKSGKRSRCTPCVAAEKKNRDASARAKREATKAEIAAASKAEVDSRTNALERLAEMHPTQFAHLLYSEQVRLGVTQIRVSPGDDYRPHRSWASQKS